MTAIKNMLVMSGLLLGLLVSIAAQSAAAPAPEAGVAARAVAFVRMLAAGKFAAAEAEFTDQMKQAAPPEKLGELWQNLLNQAGPFQGTDNTKTVLNGNVTTVIVKTNFKSRELGIAVSFDSASRIAGMHFVPAP